MDTKKTIRKILFAAIWLVMGGGMVTLLVAAIGKKNKELCSDYAITVKTKQNNFFVDEKDVLTMLKTATKGNIRGQSMSAFNLHKLEAFLEDNVWIKDAQIYFDNKDVLHVTVTEREPIARIFTVSNRSFYIDNTLKQLPLSGKVSLQVPLFTGFPDKMNSSNDSILLDKTRTIGEFISNDPFWSAQVAQVNITGNKNFEMIPVVGNHVVKLGNGDDIGKKFHRLFVFYKEVLAKTGLDKYASIDVQYDGQVVAVKGKTMTRVDSLQLRKNVEKLLLEAQKMESDTAFTTNQGNDKPFLKIDSTTAAKKELSNSNDKSKSPNPLKSTLKPGSNEIPKKPKAVLSKKN
ncbi:MAG TPA: hypothetical protein VET23_01990 [Chitinophagaceae bacterium]|nr:hypothetical protein [Chitinophagaceae bacterium]